MPGEQLERLIIYHPRPIGQCAAGSPEGWRERLLTHAHTLISVGMAIKKEMHALSREFDNVPHETI